MKKEIGAYEAKTRLPELLREVREGHSFTITNRGIAVAELRPAGHAGGDAKAAVERFQAFMKRNPVKPIGQETLRQLIEEGRE
jgi:prevent-host-death family protein